MKATRDRCGWLLVSVTTMLLLICARGTTAQMFDGIQDLAAIGTLRMTSCGDGGDTVDLNKVAAGYIYQMHYDSTRVDYTITEFRRNRTNVILLRDWRNRAVVEEYHDDQITRSENFIVNAGDTLSFYRELVWSTKYPGARFPYDYSALDTLEYSVDLFDAYTNIRLASLDSLEILPRITRGYPIIHMRRPTAATVSFIVPPGLSGANVYLKVNVHSRGNGAYYFVRYGMRTVQLSDRLLDSSYIARVRTVSGGIPLTKLVEASHSDIVLNIEPNPSHDQVTIRAIGVGMPLSIGIYDLLGNLIFMSGEIPAEVTGEETIQYQFDRAGQYYVALYHAGKLVRASMITIIK